MPEIIYTERVTVLELICASPCLTSMICFSLDMRTGAAGRSKDEADPGQRVFDLPVHMHRHRIGARGNVTCFPMPWELLLQSLRDAEEKDECKPKLPRTGCELVSIIKILLKIGKTGNALKAKDLVHVGRVRRAIVLQLILGAKARGHRGYVHLDEADVRMRAEKLPEDDVLPELIVNLDPDEDHEKLQPQKAATPRPGFSSEADALKGAAFKDARPHAVVLERVPELVTRTSRDSTR